ncbi:protein TolR [Altererythrobacter aerius]|uniref:Protein TolR n=1 Tax=Tsuneonella aeria TaxID=1837929 RepID=A0A6I4TCB8_9SPHN|nr:biopolymer transporter ExbD [Tsuneonella aeria]MXO74703.1 protein TolR [Tsuneonella aeria]
MAMGLHAKRRGRRGRAPMADINVTPLVDVMLVLLIIFMVTAPLMTAGVPVELPDSRANALDQTPEQVTISIDRAGTIFIGEDPVPEGALPEALAGLAGGGEPPQVTLRADRALDYGRVMAVMGELNRGGFNSISLVTNGSVAAP